MWFQHAVHLGECALQIRLAKNVEQAILRRDIDRTVRHGQHQCIAGAQRHEVGPEPGVLRFGRPQVLFARRQHFGDGVDADHRSWPPAEIGELQQFETAAHADIEHGGVADEIARIDRAAAAVIHLEHALWNIEIRQAPHRADGAAQPRLRRQRRFAVHIARGVEVVASVVHGVGFS